ncbi:MAG TPA: ABC transporter permease [Actinomycetota bacterium]|nr:ABC transporter permease [Actinomycetota bacterium]
MSAFWAALRFQLQLMRSNPDYLLDIATAPVYTVIFLSIVKHADRPDLIAHAVLAPALITLWWQSLMASGEVIDTDRYYGVLEPLLATPSSLHSIVLGRIAGVTLLSLVAFAESWLTARVLFGITVQISHPGWFAIALIATTAAMAGTSTIMAGLFVRTRTARTFQNSLSYPFFVLGGVMVPVALLPDWAETLSRVVFLSWSADLLRDSLAAAPVENPIGRVMIVLTLGIVGAALGKKLIDELLERVRGLGTLSQV